MKLEHTRLQAEHKALAGKKSRATHAVSAHGKGTDQLGRVLHGRRSDEVVESPPSRATLRDNPTLVEKSSLDEDPETENHTTVGQDPSNTSGAFKTHQGMLGVIGEAFSQADQLTQRTKKDEDDSERRRTRESLSDKRLVTGVRGDGTDLGYNLEVDGLSSQKSGDTIQSDEIAERYKKVKRTDDLTSARVVLDPSYIDGQQVGWNLQTAFAVKDGPDDDQAIRLRELTHISEVAKQKVDAAVEDRDLVMEQIAIKEGRLREAVRLVQEKVDDILEKTEELRLKKEQISNAESGLTDLRDNCTAKEEDLLRRLDVVLQDLDNINQDEVVALSDAFDELGEGEFSDARTKAEQIISWLQDLPRQQSKLRGMEGTKNRAAAGVEIAQTTLGVDVRYQALLLEKVTREELLETAESEAFEARKAVVEGSPDSSDSVPTPQAGYNPLTGQYEAADRPAKPGVLKGSDEEYDSLTAHHLYPWNKIRSDMNQALKKQDAGALRQLLLFGDYKPGPDFYKDLKKPSEARGYRFTSDINTAAQMICWSPKNIFMGPSSSKRGDDPGEDLDQAPTSDVPTFSTTLASLLEEQGGLGAVLDDDMIGAYLEEQEQQKKALDDSYVIKDIDESAVKAELMTRVRASMVDRAVEAQSKEDTRDREQINDELEDSAVELELGKRKLAAVEVQKMLTARSEMPQKPQDYDQDEWERDSNGKKIRLKS
jgi:hypothetical protein